MTVAMTGAAQGPVVFMIALPRPCGCLSLGVREGGGTRGKGIAVLRPYGSCGLRVQPRNHMPHGEKLLQYPHLYSGHKVVAKMA